jgi:glycosyltransferase involved in cell wall biosynthesis
MPNEPQPQGACELQGRWIDASGLPALVLPVNARRCVLADNSTGIVVVPASDPKDLFMERVTM